MRSPTRIPSSPSYAFDSEQRPRNPYDELAELADPYDPDDPLGLGLKADDEEDDSWSPPDHRRVRRRRRRRPFRTIRAALRALPLLLKVTIGLAVGTLVLVLADRCAAMYAERQAAQRVQQQLGLATAPEVTIRGFPFLTQVLDQRLEQVDIAVPDVAANRVSLATVRASARDIRLTGSLPDAIDGAVVGSLKGEVLLSFDDLNRELGASQVRFSELGHDRVRASGKLPVAGQEFQLRAEARIRREGTRGISTDVSGVRLDLPGVATYRPDRPAGLFLHRPAAERIGRDATKAKAMLSVPALARRLGVPDGAAREAQHSDARLHEITGSPRFVKRLTGVNLVDTLADHPWLLRRLGIDPDVATALTRLRPPELSKQLALSFRLPEQADELWLRHVTVERDGIRAELGGRHLDFGRGRGRD
ncbi:DUF2993 domain-containing protein [Streptomyces sp. LX-29]|uniref:DUF2993 domain-containing protein n=1 Tax=Streptomyces sp. LX-29 TaxID=2900152 RepID=UPI00240E51E1|nr:DUF2993 domain-containing protein [Streptomyces sp. LX-29]WFB08761.1 DUF2993 domain-containing protein [Streptomyces sp. LX-29]